MNIERHDPKYTLTKNYLIRHEGVYRDTNDFYAKEIDEEEFNRINDFWPVMYNERWRELDKLYMKKIYLVFDGDWMFIDLQKLKVYVGTSFWNTTGNQGGTAPCNGQSLAKATRWRFSKFTVGGLAIRLKGDIKSNDKETIKD